MIEALVSLTQGENGVKGAKGENGTDGRSGLPGQKVSGTETSIS